MAAAHLTRNKFHTARSALIAWGTDWVNGPSGTGVDDLSRPEINSTIAPAIHDFTGSFDGVQPAYLHTETFDDIHVQNIVNEIDGIDSTGTSSAPVPTLFGTNFQTLSVAQKALNSKGGGYADGHFTPNSYVAAAITYIDGAVGKITGELAAKKLLNSTLVVLSAKHGQSPAEYTKLLKIGHAVSHAVGAYLGNGSDSVTGNNLGGGQVTDDDVAFIWLNDQSQRAAAMNILTSVSSCPAVDLATKIVLSSTTLICAQYSNASSHSGYCINGLALRNFYSTQGKEATQYGNQKPNRSCLKYCRRHRSHPVW